MSQQCSYHHTEARDRLLDGRCHAKSGPYLNNRAKIHHVCSSWALWHAYLALVFSPPFYQPDHPVAGIGLGFLFELGSEPLQFPTEVAGTTLRPHIVIYSRTKKMVINLENTVLPKDNSHLVHDQNTSKYTSPCPHLRRKWLHNPCLCFGSRLSWFLPTRISHLQLLLRHLVHPIRQPAR